MKKRKRKKYNYKRNKCIERDRNRWERKGEMDQKIYKRKIGNRM